MVPMLSARRLRDALQTALMLALVFALPAAACERVAQTPYEKAYCQIQAAGQGQGLPRFEDFRRNDPQVQALLLRRPAARAGVELPDSASAGAEPGNDPQHRGAGVGRDNRSRQTDPNQMQARQTHAQQQDQRSRAETPQGLQGCRLAGDRIRCGSDAYVLLPNRPRAALAAGALEGSNRLGLPPFRGNGNIEHDRLAYTSAIYEQYVRKMLDIGLAGLTLSYTEFHRSFERHQAEGVEFTGRMDTMYRMLQEDRRTRPIQARLHDRLPDSVSDCMPLGQDLIVCDNVRTNWVFEREGR